MQNGILNSLRSLKLADSCKGGSQVCAVNPKTHRHSSHRRQGSSNNNIGTHGNNQHNHVDPTHPRTSSSTTTTIHYHSTSVPPDSLLPYGLPSPDLIDPQIDPFLRPVEPLLRLSSAYRRLSAAVDLDRCSLHLEQRSLLRFVNDPKLLRRSLRAARVHAPDLHHKVVLAAWLRYERREDEFHNHSSSSSVHCAGPSIECPTAVLCPGYNPELALALCPCRRSEAKAAAEHNGRDADEADSSDIVFLVRDTEIACVRERIAALSRPLHALLYGGFAESWRERIEFSQIEISVNGMRAIDAFSRKGKLGDDLEAEVVVELLAFSNRYCCDGLKSACDLRLSSFVRDLDDALLLIDHGLEESAHVLTASCLQAFLRRFPRSLRHTEVARLFCTGEGRARLAAAGHSSFALYHFLSEVAMEDNIRSNTTVMLMERLCEAASPGWERQLALHQLGCVMLAREEYEDAQRWFEAAVIAGHLYSVAGVARAKYRRGNRYAAFKLVNNLVCDYAQVGWMYQERSLYCITKEEKMRDLEEATRFDPTLCYPYKYRAVMMMEDGKLGAAVAEMGKVLGFMVSTDCLELRAWLSMALEDYEGALRDIRALLTLEPNYMMFHGKVHGEQLVEVLQSHVQQLNLADCWMQLYDRWSSVDDIGSLAVVHQMLAKDPCKSVLRFRQSLLLLRLNCQKAAMRCLRLARNHSLYEHERLIYEGWILYDTGHREEAIAKAEESILIQRSFEAFFLKAYALADASLDSSSAAYVIELLEEALRCPSDGLRKGQALNNLGSVYVDCNKLDQATDCYVNALNIRHTRAHQGLARVYHLKNQRKAAYDEMTKLIEKARNNASAYEKRSEYCDRDMARSDLHRATQLDPLRTYPYRYRAAVLMDDNKDDEAIAELTKALAFKPDLQLLHLRAAFYDSIGDTEATLRDCEAALCLDPNNNDTLDLYRKASKRLVT